MQNLLRYRHDISGVCEDGSSFGKSRLSDLKEGSLCSRARPSPAVRFLIKLDSCVCGVIIVHAFHNANP